MKFEICRMWHQQLNEIKEGNIKTLARCISLIENETQHYEKLLQQLPHTDKPVIGITGPPGAGKSTLVDSLIDLLGSVSAIARISLRTSLSPFFANNAFCAQWAFCRPASPWTVFVMVSAKTFWASLLSGLDLVLSSEDFQLKKSWVWNFNKYFRAGLKEVHFMDHSQKAPAFCSFVLACSAVHGLATAAESIKSTSFSPASRAIGSAIILCW